MRVGFLVLCLLLPSSQGWAAPFLGGKRVKTYLSYTIKLLLLAALGLLPSSVSYGRSMTMLTGNATSSELKWSIGQPVYAEATLRWSVGQPTYYKP
jgi:hypothetical protein